MKIIVVLVAATLGSATAWGQSSNTFEGSARDAWVAGKIEMAYTLNEHLNPFRIDTDVDSGVVTLSGTVETDVDRDLAGEIARGIEGVSDVNNELEVASDATGSGPPAEEGRDFGTWFDDATTTARVKSRLIANANIEGLEIDVDTEDDVVTLSGRVSSEEQKELAAQVARNTEGVETVQNMLVSE